MPPKPDLASNTLAHFLDRFVYRNPKITKKSRGASIMQPMLGDDTSGLLVAAQAKNRGKAPVNSQAFTELEVGNVAPDEVFFHKYFNTMGKGKDQAKKKKQKQRAQVADGTDGNEDEDEIWQALVNSKPELEEDSDAEMDSDVPESLDNDTGSVGSVDLEANMPGDDEDSEADGGMLGLEEDEDAMIGSDDDIPDDLDKAFQTEVRFSDQPSERDNNNKGRRAKRRKLKNLPTFASADDYAQMLDDDD